MITAEVLERVARAAAAAGRDPGDIRVVAASKTRTSEEARTVADAGIRVFGENYVPEALARAQALPDVELHFIGALQRNKARRPVPLLPTPHPPPPSQPARRQPQHHHHDRQKSPEQRRHRPFAPSGMKSARNVRSR